MKGIIKNMKFTHTPTGQEQINEFLNLVNMAQGAVILRSPDGDEFNLKSLFSRYIGIGRLLDEQGDFLELFCYNKADEELFFKFFNENPEVL